MTTWKKNQDAQLSRNIPRGIFQSTGGDAMGQSELLSFFYRDMVLRILQQLMSYVGCSRIFFVFCLFGVFHCSETFFLGVVTTLQSFQPQLTLPPNLLIYFEWRIEEQIEMSDIPQPPVDSKPPPPGDEYEEIREQVRFFVSAAIIYIFLNYFNT